MQFEGFAGRARQVDDGAFGGAGAGAVGDVGLWPAELAVAVAFADLDGVVEGTEAVGVLLEEHHDEAVLEADGTPEPVEALGRVFVARPARLLAGYGAVAPAAVAGARPLPRAEHSRLAPGPQGAGDAACLDEATGLQDEAVSLALGVVRLPQGGEVRAPGEVEGEPVGVLGVGGTAQAEAAQGLFHGDAQRSGLHPGTVLAERVGGADGEDTVAGAQGGVGVGHSGVRVDPEAGDQQGAARVVEDVEDAAVVGVAVAGGDVPHRERHLVYGVLVEGDRAVVGHGLPPGVGVVLRALRGGRELCGERELRGSGSGAARPGMGRRPGVRARWGVFDGTSARAAGPESWRGCGARGERDAHRCGARGAPVWCPGCGAPN